MKLELGSGRVIREATAEDIRASIAGQEFAILSTDPETYIQCTQPEASPAGYALEYQDGSLDDHYRAAEGAMALDRVISAFTKFVHGDPSWRTDCRWEKMDV